MAATKAKAGATGERKARRPRVPGLPFRCHFCGDVWTAWAPAERHATVCESKPTMTAGWIEVVLP